MSKAIKIITGTILFEEVFHTTAVDSVGRGQLQHKTFHTIARVQEGFKEVVFEGNGDVEEFAENLGGDYVIPAIFNDRGGKIVMPK